MFIRLIIYAALLAAGVLGITMSVSLQAPALILLGLAGIIAGVGFGVMGLKDKGQRGDVGRSEGQKSKGGDLQLTRYLLPATRALSILALCYFMARALASPVFDLGLEDLMLILPAGLLYLIGGYGLSGKSGVRLRQGIAWTVVVLLVAHLTSSLFQLQGGEGFSAARYFESTVRSGQGHVTGMYGYYGSFANFAVIAGLLCLSFGVWGRMAYFLRACLFVLGLVALVAAVYSGSRSAAMSLAVALLAFVILVAISFSGQSARVKKWGWIGVAVLGGGALIVGVIGAVWVFQERGGGSEGVDTFFASAARTQYWSMAVEQWTDTPFLGAGSRSFSYECFRYWNANMPTGAANPEFVHNEYLQLLADYGVVGLVLILGLFGLHLTVAGKQVRRLTFKVGEDGLKKGSNAMALNIAGMCGMIAMAVHITSDFRTHLLANLLLLVCCAVWVLPVLPVKGRKSEGLKVEMGSRGRDALMGVFVLMLGMGTAGLGAYQLWGGMPLLENRMAKEDGSWDPGQIDRSVWIPALEASVQRVPTYKRYMRLGILYQLEASEPLRAQVEREKSFVNAMSAYELSIDRNSFNPISRINLAQLYTDRGDFERADKLYASASEMAKAREKWFRMYLSWGRLHYLWALDLWKAGEINKAEEHFNRSIHLYDESRQLWGGAIYDKQWASGSLSAELLFARLLDEEKKFGLADEHFQQLRERRGWHWMMAETHGEWFQSLHYYEMGMARWMSRKPENAYNMMLEAKRALMKQNRRDHGQDLLLRKSQMKKIQEVIDFLKKAGVHADR